MEIKKEYSVVFNAISDTINRLVDLKSEIDKGLQILIDAHNIVKEMYINESEEERTEK